MGFPQNTTDTSSVFVLLRFKCRVFVKYEDMIKFARITCKLAALTHHCPKLLSTVLIIKHCRSKFEIVRCKYV